MSQTTQLCRPAEGPPSDYNYLRLKNRPPSVAGSPYLRVADLYCGAGSLSLGIWEACRRLGIGFESAAAVDNNPSALRVYAHNFPGARTIPLDILKVLDGRLGGRPTRTERKFVQDLGRLGCLLSGSPCQGFSPLNNRTRGRDVRNALYLRATRLTELALPRNLLFENVPDVLNGELDVVGITRDILERLAYSVDHSVIDLSAIGVPQARKRHVLVASRTKRVNLGDMVAASRTPRRSVWWAIWDLEKERSADIFSSPARLAAENLRRIDYLRRTRRYDLPNWLRPPCHRRVHSYKSMYGRLKYDGMAQTITSGFGSPGQGRFIHPSRRRTLSPHEAARLQFFPDYFDFTSVTKRTELAEMIGNAAPSKLSSVIGLNLLS
ncbi:MAG TPA: DNA cytosine methyltransferase [Nitrososphaerales archaeon]|nr:DNA cytosine methyltransferase [Nitrososphaerales archaeon]